MLYQQFAILTSRQLEVLHLMVQGLPYKDIAKELGITYLTVKAHAESIFNRLGVSNRNEAAAKGQLLGLVRLNGISPVAQAIIQLLVLDPNALVELKDMGLIK